MYAALDRPDIQFAAKTVMADASAPMNITEARLKRLVRYMMAAPRVEWHFPVQKLPTTVVGYSDSDWAGDRSTRRSTSGMIITFGAHSIDASSSTQACIALSSGEAELYAMGKAAASTILAANLLRELGVSAEPVVKSDSDAGRGMVRRIGAGRVRHLQLRELWLQERVREKQLRIERVDSEVNPSDIGTKYLDVGRIIKLMNSVNLKLSKGVKASGLACLEDLPLAGE